MRGLSSRTVVVTGAAGGIGAAVVERLADEGARVIGIDVRPPESPRLAYSGVCDVTDEEAVDRVFSDVESEVGPVQGLVATAGVQIAKDTHTLTAEEFRKVLDVSVIGTFLTSKRAILGMLDAGEGRIVTFGSTAAVGSAPRLASYAAAKGAVLQYTRSIAVEYADWGIRANCICPGGTMTPMMKEITESRPGVDRFLARHPIGRYADPSEIAAVVAFLLSDDSSFMLGSAVMADGGFSIN